MTTMRSTMKAMLAVATACLFFAVSPAAAQCIPQNFPNDWLQQQENAGGHTIARHVGKTDQDLVNRLNNDPNITAASTYPDQVSAQATITSGLGAQRVIINNWAQRRRNGVKRVFDYAAADVVGRVAYRPPDLDNIVETSNFRAIIKTTGGGGCFLLTSYPIE